LVESFVDKLFDFDDDYASVSVVADYDTIKNIFKVLVSDKYESVFDIAMINIDNIEYFGEYILTISDVDMKIWIEPAWIKNDNYCGYLNIEGNALFVHETVSFNILNSITADEVIIFGLEN